MPRTVIACYRLRCKKSPMACMRTPWYAVSVSRWLTSKPKVCLPLLALTPIATVPIMAIPRLSPQVARYCGKKTGASKTSWTMRYTKPYTQVRPLKPYKHWHWYAPIHGLKICKPLKRNISNKWWQAHLPKKWRIFYIVTARPVRCHCNVTDKAFAQVCPPLKKPVMTWAGVWIVPVKGEWIADLKIYCLVKPIIATRCYKAAIFQAYCSPMASKITPPSNCNLPKAKWQAVSKPMADVWTGRVVKGAICSMPAWTKCLGQVMPKPRYWVCRICLPICWLPIMARPSVAACIWLRICGASIKFRCVLKPGEAMPKVKRHWPQLPANSAPCHWASTNLTPVVRLIYYQVRC